MSNRNDRKKMVLAMEFIARQVNDENIFMSWLYSGVADGDIPYGCLDTESLDEYGFPLDLDYYTEDDHLSELMGLFLRMMSKALKSGGLYCDGIADDNKTN
jgi:hypothetical protein